MPHECRRDTPTRPHTWSPLLVPFGADQKVKNVLFIKKGEFRLKELKDENPSRFLFAGESACFLLSLSVSFLLPLIFLSPLFLFYVASPVSASLSLIPSIPSLPSCSHFIRLACPATLQKLLSRAGLLSLARTSPPEPTGYSFRCLTSVEHN